MVSFLTFSNMYIILFNRTHPRLPFLNPLYTDFLFSTRTPSAFLPFFFKFFETHWGLQEHGHLPSGYDPETCLSLPFQSLTAYKLGRGKMSPPHLHERVFTDPVSCREVIMAVDRAVQECQEPGHAIPGSLSILSLSFPVS